jgi:ubiquitin C-terminal hydrolase
VVQKQDLKVVGELFGVIVHEGQSINSGHYYSYVKGGCGRWYIKNDSHVRFIPASLLVPPPCPPRRHACTARGPPAWL